MPLKADTAGAKISYFLTGPFGGYGNEVKIETGRQSYPILAVVDGKPAVEAKVVVYMPGCEIVKFDIHLGGAPEQRSVSCKALSWQILRGRVMNASGVPRSALLYVSYLAFWGHQFFGISDGMVLTIPIGSSVPNESGEFEVRVPDFYKSTEVEDGAFEFVLRDPKSFNNVATLTPVTTEKSPPWLKVQPSYPWVLQFRVLDQ